MSDMVRHEYSLIVCGRRTLTSGAYLCAVFIGPEFACEGRFTESHGSALISASAPGVALAVFCEEPCFPIVRYQPLIIL